MPRPYDACLAVLLLTGLLAEFRYAAAIFHHGDTESTEKNS
jgi:hypothetical protein